MTRYLTLELQVFRDDWFGALGTPDESEFGEAAVERLRPAFAKFGLRDDEQKLIGFAYHRNFSTPLRGDDSPWWYGCNALHVQVSAVSEEERDLGRLDDAPGHSIGVEPIHLRAFWADGILSHPPRTRPTEGGRQLGEVTEGVRGIAREVHPDDEDSAKRLMAFLAAGGDDAAALANDVDLWKRYWSQGFVEARDAIAQGVVFRWERFDSDEILVRLNWHALIADAAWWIRSTCPRCVTWWRMEAASPATCPGCAARVIPSKDAWPMLPLDAPPVQNHFVAAHVAGWDAQLLSHIRSRLNRSFAWSDAKPPRNQPWRRS